jgi:hypothetical protein
MDHKQNGSAVDEHIRGLQWREQHHHGDLNQHSHEPEPTASTACDRPYNTAHNAADDATYNPANYSAHYPAKPRYVTNHPGEPGIITDQLYRYRSAVILILASEPEPKSITDSLRRFWRNTVNITAHQPGTVHSPI